MRFYGIMIILVNENMMLIHDLGRGDCIVQDTLTQKQPVIKSTSQLGHTVTSYSSITVGRTSIGLYHG